MDEARRGYILSTAHRFADLVESRIGMCYLRPKEQWLPCIEGDRLKIVFENGIAITMSIDDVRSNATLDAVF